MRVLIVKLSSLGDVVHAMPVVHDIRRVHPAATIDWVVEPGFAPLLRRMRGLAEVIECPLRRWTRMWWRGTVRRELRELRARLEAHAYDAILDLQGLTKSALIAWLARGTRYGLANRTEGASHEPPARWLAHRPIRIEPRIHALDRSRELAARALGYRLEGAPDFGLGHAKPPSAAGHADGPPTLLLIHGSSRADKLWPEADWIAFGQRALADGWRLALPQAGAEEAARAARLEAALGPGCSVWPSLDLGAVIDRMRGVHGAIGVDSGLSHIATALDLPHVQIYNFPTAWRTGPLPSHGHHHQVAVEGRPAPTLDAIWQAWTRVRPGARE
jgi:heptosyltransferase-1